MVLFYTMNAWNNVNQKIQVQQVYTYKPTHIQISPFQYAIIKTGDKQLYVVSIER